MRPSRGGHSPAAPSFQAATHPDVRAAREVLLHEQPMKVTLVYNDGHGQRPNGQIIRERRLVMTAFDLGLDGTFQLTPTVARILRDNRDLLEVRVPEISNALQQHRDFFRAEMEDKAIALSYSSLPNVAGDDRLSPEQLAAILETTELASSVRNMVADYPATIRALHQRMRCVNRSRITQWWYLLCI